MVVEAQGLESVTADFAEATEATAARDGSPQLLPPEVPRFGALKEALIYIYIHIMYKLYNVVDVI